MSESGTANNRFISTSTTSISLGKQAPEQPELRSLAALGARECIDRPTDQERGNEQREQRCYRKQQEGSAFAERERSWQHQQAALLERVRRRHQAKKLE